MYPVKVLKGRPKGQRCELKLSRKEQVRSHQGNEAPG